MEEPVIACLYPLMLKHTVKVFSSGLVQFASLVEILDGLYVTFTSTDTIGLDLDVVGKYTFPKQRMNRHEFCMLLSVNLVHVY